MHHERHGWGELVGRTTIKPDEFLTVELERYSHDGAFRSGTRIAVSHDGTDLRILEDGRVEMHRLFSIAIEPQERSDLLHRVPLIASAGSPTERLTGRTVSVHL